MSDPATRDEAPAAPDAEAPPARNPRYTVRRAERRAAMAAQSWPHFFRDLAVRFLVAGAVALVIAGAMWLSAR